MGSGGIIGSGGRLGTGGVPGSGGIIGSGGRGGVGGTGTAGRLGTGGVVGSGGLIGSGGIVGSGGLIGSGGIIGTGGIPGSGGRIGTGGAGGMVGPSCDSIVAAYSAALSAAKVCSGSMVQPLCAQKAVSILGCNCLTYVNDTSGLVPIATQWNNSGCTMVCTLLCVVPQVGSCNTATGMCQDALLPPPGTL